MVQAAYYLYSLHNVMPSEYYQMGYGEKAVLSAFLDYEMEQKQKEYEAIRNPAKDKPPDGKDKPSLKELKAEVDKVNEFNRNFR